jgi:hypothetical protein
MERWSVLPLQPTYIGEKRRTLGIKARCYGGHPWGTHREHVGNKGEMKKKSLAPLPKL